MGSISLPRHCNIVFVDDNHWQAVGWWLMVVAAVAGFHQSLMFQNIQNTAIGLASFAAEVCID